MGFYRTGLPPGLLELGNCIDPFKIEFTLILCVGHEAVVSKN